MTQKRTGVIDAQAQFSKAVCTPDETEDETIQRLAALTEIQYDQCREAEAENLSIRVSTLDKLVKLERMTDRTPDIVESLEPWADSVDLAQVLTQVEQQIKAYAVLPSGGSTAVSLWIASAYLMDEFRIFPKLIIYSPEKRCGKSTVLDLVEAFSPRALFASSISQAAIYRVIEAHQPTLIIDEADTFVANRNDEMVGIINSGHSKNRARVVRCEGDDNKTRAFSTWSPMVLASIKTLQGTIMDRGVCIELRRKMNHEKVQRIPADLTQRMKQSRQKLTKWALDNASTVSLKQIEPPHTGNDRAVDNWIPLFSLAHLAGGNWPDKVLNAYAALTQQEEEQTAQVMLLSDIRDVINEHKGDRIPSKELVDLLLALEERPWREWRRGQPMTQNSLAKLLGAFTIKSKTIRYFSKTCKGFEKQQFDDAFTRYLV